MKCGARNTGDKCLIRELTNSSVGELEEGLSFFCRSQTVHDIDRD